LREFRGHHTELPRSSGRRSRGPPDGIPAVGGAAIGIGAATLGRWGGSERLTIADARNSTCASSGDTIRNCRGRVPGTPYGIAAEFGPAESRATRRDSSGRWSGHRYRRRHIGPLGRVRTPDQCRRSKQHMRSTLVLFHESPIRSHAPGFACTPSVPNPEERTEAPSRDGPKLSRILGPPTSWPGFGCADEHQCAGTGIRKIFESSSPLGALHWRELKRSRFDGGTFGTRGHPEAPPGPL